MVTGSVLVSEGVKLTVEAGVEVKFDSGKSLQVFGELVAQGTSSSGITFTSVQESKAAGDWGQIVFYDSSVDASYDGNGDYASGSILEYCTVEYGGGIQLNLANPFINQGTIRYHSGRGIGTDNYNSSNNSATLKITNNTISNNVGGVYLYGLGTVLVSGNTISNNNVNGSGGGIKIDGGDGVTISGNTIENNVASNEGGGIGGGGGYQVFNNVIMGNHARVGGGIKGGGTITGNVIRGNTTTEPGNVGGGFYDDSPGTFSNNYVLNNGGGGIYSPNGQSSITGNIIAGNTGGALHYKRGQSDSRSVSGNTIFDNTGSPVVYLKSDNDNGILEVRNNTVVGNSGSPTVSLGKAVRQVRSVQLQQYLRQ